MINRDNYEAFFLMYVDGELSTTDKEMVEAFVQLHPDLQEELAMLQQTVLLPEDDIVFANKNLLFKHTESNVAVTEEQLLLYIDNELNLQDKVALEAAVVSNTSLQKDLALLQQTKLPLETIAYPNKEELYREEKKRKVVYMRWQYMAAAAIVIGLIATVYFVVPSGNTSGTSLASTDNTQKAPTPATPDAIIPNETPVTVAPKTDVPATTVASNNTNKATKKLPVTQAVVTTQQPLVATNNTKPFKDGAQEFLTSPSKNIENNIASTVTNPSTNRNNNSIAKNEPKDATSPSLPVVTNTLNTTTIAAQQVVYKELDTDSDDKSLLVGSIEINKDKLRGFLRKASKLFGNKQKSDDDTKSSLATNK